mmetsp:Transcript_72312/g.169318  ORF Transcript_72312/g.169318 Transcript_72312/m.169318 type:complete len:222 (+) Transcript_72312:1724-2389(+)
MQQPGRWNRTCSCLSLSSQPRLASSSGNRAATGACRGKSFASNCPSPSSATAASSRLSSSRRGRFCNMSCTMPPPSFLAQFIQIPRLCADSAADQIDCRITLLSVSCGCKASQLMRFSQISVLWIATQMVWFLWRTCADWRRLEILSQHLKCLKSCGRRWLRTSQAWPVHLKFWVQPLVPAASLLTSFSVSSGRLKRHASRQRRHASQDAHFSHQATGARL